MNSYPTPSKEIGIERMNDGFVKLHPGAPVHVFTEAHDEEFHDHPFNFVTHIVAGSYTEQVLLLGDGPAHHIATFHRQAGTSHEVQAGTIHRITGLPEGYCVTRAEYGAKEREPGFYRLTPGGVEHRFWHEETWQRWPRPVA